MLLRRIFDLGGRQTYAEGLRPSARSMHGMNEVRLRWIAASGWRLLMEHVVRWLRRSGKSARDGVWLFPEATLF